MTPPPPSAPSPNHLDHRHRSQSPPGSGPATGTRESYRRFPCPIPASYLPLPHFRYSLPLSREKDSLFHWTHLEIRTVSLDGELSPFHVVCVCVYVSGMTANALWICGWRKGGEGGEISSI